MKLIKNTRRATISKAIALPLFIGLFVASLTLVSSEQVNAGVLYDYDHSLDSSKSWGWSRSGEAELVGMKFSPPTNLNGVDYIDYTLNIRGTYPTANFWVSVWDASYVSDRTDLTITNEGFITTSLVKDNSGIYGLDNTSTCEYSYTKGSYTYCQTRFHFQDSINLDSTKEYYFFLTTDGYSANSSNAFSVFKENKSDSDHVFSHVNYFSDTILNTSSWSLLTQLGNDENYSPTPPDTTTRIYSINSPEISLGAGTITDDLIFDFDIYNGDTLATDFRIDLENISTYQTLPSYLEELNTSGEDNITYTYEGLPDAFYQWRAVLLDYSGNEIDSTDYYIYKIGEPAFSPLYPEPTATTTDNSGFITGIFEYLFIPSADSLNNIRNSRQQLMQKAPFVYLTDFKDTYYNLFANTGASAAITIDFGDIGTLTIISQQQIADVPFANLIKNSLTAMMWILFGLTIYRRTLRIHDNNTVQ